MGKGTTEKGYLNKNSQENLGSTNEPGTDFGQTFYLMKCHSLLENGQECGYVYRANGSDIWQRKCPKCQGGRP